MRSPLLELRERLGLTISEMAAALGLHYASYYNAEVGLGAIPKKARAALEELSVDFDNLTDLQARWINERAAERRQVIMAKAGAA
ncbi:MAG: helix-turn-helix domain-containing protein [Armatimonadota bacterium]